MISLGLFSPYALKYEAQCELGCQGRPFSAGLNWTGKAAVSLSREQECLLGSRNGAKLGLLPPRVGWNPILTTFSR